MIPIELIALPPLAAAAGVDLYLTLLFIGAAPTTGLWETPLPGALGDLDSPSVLMVVGSLYLMEFVAERFEGSALTWNAFHAIIRPVSGALLALLLLDGQPLALLVPGCIVGGLLASLAHSVRTGRSALRWMIGGEAPSSLLVSLLEDALVVGMVALTLDAPRWALAVSLIAVLVVSPRVPSFARAFAYAIRLAALWVFANLEQRRWKGPEEIPRWVVHAMDEDDTIVPGGALRGSPAGAYRLRGAPPFASGWVAVRGRNRAFVHKTRRGARRIDVSDLETDGVAEHDLFRRVDLRDEPARTSIIFDAGGPSVESLRSEFTLEENL